VATAAGLNRDRLEPQVRASRRAVVDRAKGGLPTLAGVQAVPHAGFIGTGSLTDKSAEAINRAATPVQAYSRTVTRCCI
jgi:hypothetical protein